MKGVLSALLELAKIGIIALLIVAPLRMFVFQPFVVRGESMEPNFHNGDYLIVDEISYRFRDVRRGEVIVFKFPEDLSQRFIKRVIGLPGESVSISSNVITVFNTQDGQNVFVLDEQEYLPENAVTPGTIQLTLEEGEYFVLGDNRRFSSDSRKWGALPEENIIGRTFVRLLPPNAFAKVEAPLY